ncbi:SHOCT domain-containing protein [Streptomyces celluloflavus]|uniref:SHOCT domain-containing protein n=1 Tax=Streptomyces celluloflavus TaxID=58344 RepID=UPI0036BF3FB2
MMFWYGHAMNGWGWLGMMTGTVLLWALIIVIAVLVFRALARPGPPGGEHTGRRGGPAPGGPTPERILAERYARGEIDDEEYRRRLATLRDMPPGPAQP